MIDAAEAPPDAVAGVEAVAEAEGLRRELAKAVAAQTSLAQALQQAWAREESAEMKLVGSGAESTEASDSISAEEAGTLAAAVASTEAALVAENM